MSMSPCTKCLENQWKYEYNEGIIIATCKLCDHEVMFEAKKKHKKPIDTKRFLPVSTADRYVPGGRPIDREGKFPWEE